MSLKVITKNDTLTFGEPYGLSIEFQRTLRIPDDGKTYPLPPGLGRFPIKKISDYADKVPAHWREHGGVFIPMYQREALWLNFQSLNWRPHALKVAIGKVNAVSGKLWQQKLVKRDGDEPDYVVAPPQPWLDGINSGEGYIKQFVAMPLGMGYTIEAQLTGEEVHGGIQIIVFAPKPGKFPDKPPQQNRMERGITLGLIPPAPQMDMMMSASSGEMGLGAGGKMKQKIYPDPHGIDTWDEANTGRVFVHIVNSMMYREITGEEAPPTPITAKTYTQRGYPWFDLYDEKMGDISAPDSLKGVKSIKEMDQEKGATKPLQDDDPVDVPDDKVIKYNIDPDEVEDGNW